MTDGHKPHAINKIVKVNVYEWDCDVAERTLERKLEEVHKSFQSFEQPYFQMPLCPA